MVSVIWSLHPHANSHVLGYQSDGGASTMGVVKRQMVVSHSCMASRIRMLLGQHHVFINSDRLLIIPEPFRELFKDGAYVTRGFENDLLIMSDKIFQEIYKRVVALNIADPLARLLIRLILG